MSAPRPEWQVKAEALREAARDLSWLGAQGSGLLEIKGAWHGVTECMDTLERMADAIEGENK